MSNLSIDEKIQLEEILTGYFEKLQKPSENLKALINISEVQIDIKTIDYNLPVKELVTNFYGLILKKPEDLESFLQYLQNKLDSDERLTIKGYIEKLKRSPTKKTANFRQLISEKRQQNHEIPTSKTGIRIDDDIIVKYDLDELVYKFKKALDYQGVFAFNLREDYTILKNYIIQRILQELEEKTQRSYRSPIEIRLNPNQSIESIDNYLKIYKNINKITDLLIDISPLDVVLIIWTYNIIDKHKLNSMIDNFLQQIKTKCDGFFENKSQCLIILFANVNAKSYMQESISMEKSINDCITLDLPQKFDINKLCQWFRGILQQSNTPEHEINMYLERLKSVPYDLLPIYNTLEEIIHELRTIN